MTVQATDPKKRKGDSLLTKIVGPVRGVWGFALAFAFLAGFGALSILGHAAANETYYVLNQAVPARTQIEPSMLAPLEAKDGQAPPNALDPSYVRDHAVFAKIALSNGDVITPTNAGPLGNINANIPSNYVAASFSVNPEDAVAGKVRTGNYIDIIAVNASSNSDASAKVILEHVLVTDVTVSPDSISQEAVSGQVGTDLDPGPESSAVRGGIPSLYTVAVDPEDAAKLALARSYDLYVVLSSNDTPSEMNVQATENDLFNGTVADSSKGINDPASTSNQSNEVTPPTSSSASTGQSSSSPSTGTPSTSASTGASTGGPVSNPSTGTPSTAPVGKGH